MKNFLLFLLVVFAGIFMSCNYTPPTPPSCNDFSAECELMKPWAAVKVVNFIDTGAVDAYGEKIKIGSWYVRSSQTTLLFPLPNCGRVSYTGNQWLENILKGDDGAIGILNKTAVKLDTIRFLIGFEQGESRKTTNAAVFCIEKGQIEYFYGSERNGFKSSFNFSFYKKE